MNTRDDNKTLRLLFPQWQGGNNPPYHLGGKLLDWLAPAATGPVEEVAVPPPDGKPLPLEDGIVARSALLAQLHQARRLLDTHRPDRVVTLGGDCLVDLAPFAYLNERYGGELAVLWVDTHPDIMTPAQFNNAHAMVMGTLLGRGDADFVRAVARPIKPQNLLYAGLHDPTDWEAGEMHQRGLRSVSPGDLAKHGSQPVLDWFRSTGARHLAVHFDLDTLDPKTFGAVLFAQPDASLDAFEGIAQGELTPGQVVRLLADVAQVADIVGLGITEHLPWDALALRDMLSKLPLLGNSCAA